MKSQIHIFLRAIASRLGLSECAFDLTVSEDPVHGDYATNLALIGAKVVGKPPRDLALQAVSIFTAWKEAASADRHDQTISKKDQSMPIPKGIESILRDIDRIEVAGPGFLNIFLSEASFITHLSTVLKIDKPVVTRNTKNTDFQVMVEFAHPNTHKQFHIGHLRNITTGEAIVRLLESQGMKVVRANYQGDVGLHIGKALWGVMKLANEDAAHADRAAYLDALKTVEERSAFLGKAYATGAGAYETDEAAKKEIEEINKKVYAREGAVYSLYQQTRQWSLDYFEAVYARVGSRFDRYYFESQTYESGREAVLEGLKKGIFERSEGAVIFPGEKYGLHNRVFITSGGNPTYEAKDMGLGRLQFDEYHPERIIHCVASEQTGYFQVIFEALARLYPDTKGKEQHLIYGWVRLKEGKMSSRSGNVVLGSWLLDETKKSIRLIMDQNKSKYTESEQNEVAEKAAIAAVKYGFLKVSTQQDIAFDIKESININGDSGPYLLYTYARCKSVLRKAGSVKANVQLPDGKTLSGSERLILRHMVSFYDTISRSAVEYAPSYLCTYLLRLAGLFNAFYNGSPILDAPEGKETRDFRLGITTAVAQTLKHGLYLLGIETVERM